MDEARLEICGKRKTVRNLAIGDRVVVKNWRGDERVKTVKSITPVIQILYEEWDVEDGWNADSFYPGQFVKVATPADNDA